MRNRGRGAKNPGELTERGWRDVLLRTWRGFKSQQSSIIAAGIAFFGVWAFFPALVALTGLGALIFGRPTVLRLIAWAKVEVPKSFAIVILGHLQQVINRSNTWASLTFAAGLAMAAWGGMRAMRGLIAAMNIIYGETERRSFWHRQGLALAFTAFGGLFLLIALGLILAIPPWAPAVDGNMSYLLVVAARWPVLILVAMLLLATIYRYGPSRQKTKWRWVSWGAGMAGAVWVTCSLLLSWYASHFAQFNPLLGSLGAFIVFFLWAYLSVSSMLLGARINAEMERQTEADTTAGDDLPLGCRGARVADTVADDDRSFEQPGARRTSGSGLREAIDRGGGRADSG